MVSFNTILTDSSFLSQHHLRRIIDSRHPVSNNNCRRLRIDHCSFIYHGHDDWFKVIFYCSIDHRHMLRMDLSSISSAVAIRFGLHCFQLGTSELWLWGVWWFRTTWRLEFHPPTNRLTPAGACPARWATTPAKPPFLFPEGSKFPPSPLVNLTPATIYPSTLPWEMSGRPTKTVSSVCVRWTCSCCVWRRGWVPGIDFWGLGCSQRLPLSVWVVPAILRVPVAGWPKKRELGPLSSGQGKLMPFVDPDRIEQSDRVQAASFAHHPTHVETG